MEIISPSREFSNYEKHSWNRIGLQPPSCARTEILKIENFKLMRTLNTITRSALLVQAIVSSGRIQIEMAIKNGNVKICYTNRSNKDRKVQITKSVFNENTGELMKSTLERELACNLQVARTDGFDSKLSSSHRFMVVYTLMFIVFDHFHKTMRW